MKRSFVIAVLMISVALPALAQDHSQHRNVPSVSEPFPKASPPIAEDHSQHATPAASQPAKEGTRRSESRHVPPDPPEHVLLNMSEERMTELMEMDDTDTLGKFLLDELETSRAGNQTVVGWDAQAWYGGDYDKVWVESEGERNGGKRSGRGELLWDHVFARWWSMQTGIRRDFGAGARTWGTIGVRGLAPYWFYIDAALYVGGGRAAARFKADYEVLFTQRLILQPEAGMNLYSKDDHERSIGSGLSDLEIGFRLRYELRREVAPYVGIAFLRRFGGTADYARANGEDSSEIRALAGVRAWF